jgi:polyhydroxyalkanoate synthesis regulator phasin
MSNSAKRRLVVGATGLAVLAGGGGAYAAGQTSTPAAPKTTDRAAEQNAFLDDVAKRLNVTRDQLDAAVKGAAEARIDAAVAAGKLTKEQGEAAKQRLANGVPLLGGPGPLGGRPGGGPGGPRMGFGGFGLDGAATYLGLTEDALRTQLESGKSLADVAKAQNKDVAGLKAAMKTALTKHLDQAVKDGDLTADQRTKILAEADQHLDDMINGTHPARPDRPKFRWR